jgi:hypothetical protein
VIGRARGLERAAEAALSLGLGASTLLLIGGLLGGWHAALQVGIVVLMFTPVARVVVVTIGLVHERDWPFALASLAVLAILVSGMAVAARL